MREISVFTDREDEDLTWLFAWCLAEQSREDLDEYDIEENNKVTVTDGVANRLFVTFKFESNHSTRTRTLAFIYEWSLFGYEPAQRCMQAFYRAMLGTEKAV